MFYLTDIGTLHNAKKYSLVAGLVPFPKPKDPGKLILTNSSYKMADLDVNRGHFSKCSIKVGLCLKSNLPTSGTRGHPVEWLLF